MIVSDLERYEIIDKSNLDKSRYFQSLLEQAYQKGLLTDKEIERIQFECIQLLASITEKYNGGDSSSIRIEKAESLMASSFFSISLWLKTYQNPDDAVSLLKNSPLAEIYKQGRKRIDTRVASSKMIYKKLLEQFMDIPNECYQATVLQAISGFFKLYYPDFGAHEIHITADYPTFFPRSRLEGIEFIQEYLRQLFYENQFCTHFNKEDICHLLSGYQDDYQENIFNLYRPILYAALGCVAINGDLKSLNITEDGRHQLIEMLTQKSEENLFSFLQETTKRMIQQLGCSPGLSKYILDCLPVVTGEIQLAINQHSLEQLFALPDYPETRPYILISYGSKMDNDDYRKIVEEIELCDTVSEKISIIKNEIHSLADLEDILIDCNFTRNELRIILQELELSEIIALYKHLCAYEQADYAGTQKALLCECLNNYKATLSPQMQKTMEKALKAIREE